MVNVAPNLIDAPGTRDRDAHPDHEVASRAAHFARDVEVFFR
jgi:hypothetical protein